MSVTQTQFRRVILDPKRAMPEGLVDADGTPDAKRFNVYRNNVAVSLTEALEVAFPVVLKLVGQEFFHAMTSIFLREFPPSSPMLMQYGAELPAFIRTFKPASHLKYLPSVARLEQSMRRAYHAADAQVFDPTDLQTLSTDELMASRMILAPAVDIVRSDWPIHGIWQFNTHNNAPDPARVAEDVLVSRPEFDPVLKVLPESGAEFILALQKGETFGAALGMAKTKSPNFDLTGTLGAMISGGAIAAIKKG